MKNRVGTTSWMTGLLCAALLGRAEASAGPAGYAATAAPREGSVPAEATADARATGTAGCQRLWTGLTLLLYLLTGRAADPVDLAVAGPGVLPALSAIAAELVHSGTLPDDAIWPTSPLRAGDSPWLFAGLIEDTRAMLSAGAGRHAHQTVVPSPRRAASGPPTAATHEASAGSTAVQGGDAGPRFGGCYNPLQEFCDRVHNLVDQLEADDIAERNEAVQELVHMWNAALSHCEGAVDQDPFGRFLICIRKHMADAFNSENAELSGRAAEFFRRIEGSPVPYRHPHPPVVY